MKLRAVVLISVLVLSGSDAKRRRKKGRARKLTRIQQSVLLNGAPPKPSADIGRTVSMGKRSNAKRPANPLLGRLLNLNKAPKPAPQPTKSKHWLSADIRDTRLRQAHEYIKSLMDIQGTQNVENSYANRLTADFNKLNSDSEDGDNKCGPGLFSPRNGILVDARDEVNQFLIPAIGRNVFSIPVGPEWHKIRTYDELLKKFKAASAVNAINMPEEPRDYIGDLRRKHQQINKRTRVETPEKYQIACETFDDCTRFVTVLKDKGLDVCIFDGVYSEVLVNDPRNRLYLQARLGRDLKGTKVEIDDILSKKTRKGPRRRILDAQAKRKSVKWRPVKAKLAKAPELSKASAAQYPSRLWARSLMINAPTGQEPVTDTAVLVGYDDVSVASSEDSMPVEVDSEELLGDGGDPEGSG